MEKYENNRISINDLYEIITVLRDSECISPKIKYLIQNLLDRRNEGWKESILSKDWKIKTRDELKSEKEKENLLH